MRSPGPRSRSTTSGSATTTTCSRPAAAASSTTGRDSTPARTLLVIDEAHNLASRVADAYSHAFSADDARRVCEALRDSGAPSGVRREVGLVGAVPRIAHSARRPSPRASRQDAREQLAALAEGVGTFPVDYAELGPEVSGLIWSIPSFTEQLAAVELPRLWWSPTDGDALGHLPRRRPRDRDDPARVWRRHPGDRHARAPSTGSPRAANWPPSRRSAPARRGGTAPTTSAVDLRVDTTFQQRQRYIGTTARDRLARCTASAGGAPVAVFFPSFAYAEAVAREVEAASLQPRRSDLSAQNAWINRNLDDGRALFLVLGSGFAEGIDLLGGRVSNAMVVGPALPEVNPVQRAKLAAFAELGPRRGLRPGLPDTGDAEGRTRPGAPRPGAGPAGPRAPALPALCRARLRAPAFPGIPVGTPHPRRRRTSRRGSARPSSPFRFTGARPACSTWRSGSAQDHRLQRGSRRHRAACRCH